MHQPSEGGTVSSVDRVATVLEILAREPAGVAVGSVALELGVHRSTASRLLSALEARDLVEQDGERGRYRLGFGLLRLGGAVLARLDLVEAGHDIVQDCATRLGETVNVAVLRSHWAVNVDQARGPAAVAAQNWTGQLTPLHATSSGKVLLAHCSRAVRAELLDAAAGVDGLQRFTEHTVVDRAVLLAELDEVAEAGHACAFEEFADGLNAVAAPVRDHTRQVVAAVSVSGPAFRFERTVMDKAVAELVDAAALISGRLGEPH